MAASLVELLRSEAVDFRLQTILPSHRQARETGRGPRLPPGSTDPIITGSLGSRSLALRGKYLLFGHQIQIEWGKPVLDPGVASRPATVSSRDGSHSDTVPCRMKRVGSGCCGASTHDRRSPSLPWPTAPGCRPSGAPEERLIGGPNDDQVVAFGFWLRPASSPLRCPFSRSVSTSVIGLLSTGMEACCARTRAASYRYRLARRATG